MIDLQSEFNALSGHLASLLETPMGHRSETQHALLSATTKALETALDEMEAADDMHQLLASVQIQAAREYMQAVLKLDTVSPKDQPDPKSAVRAAFEAAMHALNLD